MPVWDGGLVTAVDLDLDVIRRFDGTWYVDDEDEFAEHQVSYGYPPELVASREAECARVSDEIRSGGSLLAQATPLRPGGTSSAPPAAPGRRLGGPGVTGSVTKGPPGGCRLVSPRLAHRPLQSPDAGEHEQAAPRASSSSGAVGARVGEGRHGSGGADEAGAAAGTSRGPFPGGAVTRATVTRRHPSPAGGARGASRGRRG